MKGNKLPILPHLMSTKNKRIILIVENLSSFETITYMTELKKKFLNISKFDDIKAALFFLKCISFELTYVIISASLYNEFLQEFKAIESELLTAPKIIIISSSYSDSLKINQLKEINDTFYNIGGIVFTIDDVKTFLIRKLSNIVTHKYINLIKPKDIYLSFQTVLNKNDLIGPCFISDIISDPIESEFRELDRKLIKIYGEQEEGQMQDLILQIYGVNCPYSLRVKYWLRAYTLNTFFYKDMNTELMQRKTREYLPYIKLLYYGLEHKYFSNSFSKEMYRGAIITDVEIERLLNYKVEKNEGLPFGLLYCKSFISFSLDKNVALEIMKKQVIDLNHLNQSKVLYILQRGDSNDIKNATNADLAEVSYYKKEQEILFFPFSIFEINKIEKKDTYYEITLNYLGKYRKLFNFNSNNEILCSLSNTEYVKDLYKSGCSQITDMQYMNIRKRNICIDLTERINIERIKKGISNHYENSGGIDAFFNDKMICGKDFGLEEFKIIFNNINITDINEESVKKLIKIFDKDKDGKLNREEFLCLYTFK